MTVLKFRAPPRPAKMGASRWVRWRSRAELFIGRVANACGWPGAIADAEIVDGVSGQHIAIRRGLLFTVVSVNGRDYYFRRFSGKLDGTGIGCVSRPSPEPTK